MSEVNFAERYAFYHNPADGAYGWRLAPYEALAFSLQTFPGKRTLATVEHLRREVQELADNPSSPEELADVFILLMRAAHNVGVDLPAAVLAKLDVNRTRTWGEPDDAGVVEHVR